MTDSTAPGNGTDMPRQEEFVLLYTKTSAALFSYSLSLLPNWSDAEDILQQTSLELWRKFSQFEAGSDFLAWACQIARYKALTLMRSRGRDRHVFSLEVVERIAEEGIAETRLLDAERKALNDCLQKLRASERELLQRCYAVGATIKQVAEQVGRTPNSLYKVLNRIREALLRCIEARLAEADL
jgi:RNA polymerase sigma-70 factor (ECF subfamily)